ncbi:hypothetical protein ABEW05_006634 [Botrytis cinerea]
MENTLYEQLDEMKAGNVDVDFEPYHASIQNFIASLERCFSKGALSVSRKVELGSTLAVKGPSGAGNSFHPISDEELKTIPGKTHVNGDARSMSEFKKIIGYLLQDDAILPELTVRRAFFIF